MCGIAGIFNLENSDPVEERDIRRMLGTIRHRGPDEFGIYLDGPVGLGNARLSIIDLSGGQQPISNEDGTMWIVFNGEIFNYVELRPQLEARGHRFSTSSDTEVLLHAYEEWGTECLDRLNGQFAFAVWNTRDRSLFLARDRVGVRPLFYCLQKGRFVFGSEIKAILASGTIAAEVDPAVLEQVFTFWCPISPATIFKGIKELPPGSCMEVRAGACSARSYWELAFPEANGNAEPVHTDERTQAFEEQLGTLLVDAARIRLRADVPVGAYLSGGLDSSVIASIIRNFTSNRLDTFSIAFDDTSFDESAWQRKMAKFLGTEHKVVNATHADIGKVFPDVIWHAEVPLMRTAPAPMFMLSKLVRDSGYKVVLTGEGADEFLAGYDIFKEAKVRRFWAGQPGSTRRPLLLGKLYPDITTLGKTHTALLTAFFQEGLTDVDWPFYSHSLRWRNGRRNTRFFSNEIKSSLNGAGYQVVEQMLPAAFGAWAPLCRAQYLEIKIFLSQYLLSSQGDRMGMAHSIEGRFPFLDHRVVAFCNQLPPRLKLRALTEKYLLKKLGKRWLPPEIWQRPKRPYRAPIHRSFFNAESSAYVEELLSVEKIKANGYFKPQAVGQLVQKVQQRQALGETDDMALAGIISTQLLHHLFVQGVRKCEAVSGKDRVKIVMGKGARRSSADMSSVG
jgi:asparagine synthase (glutamine-hydrolysing)